MKRSSRLGAAKTSEFDWSPLRQQAGFLSGHWQAPMQVLILPNALAIKEVSRREESNLRPMVYETIALPLSYAGVTMRGL